MKTFAICVASIICGACIYHAYHCPTFKSDMTHIVSR